MVLQDEWVQLYRGKWENVPSGREGRGQKVGQEDGVWMAGRTEEAIEDVFGEELGVGGGWPG